jgi:hypothetical protein
MEWILRDGELVPSSTTTFVPSTGYILPTITVHILRQGEWSPTLTSCDLDKRIKRLSQQIIIVIVGRILLERV